MKKVIVIAEAGVNHNGSIEMAKKLIEEAAHAGADYVKFQTFKASKNISKHADKAEYQNLNTGDSTESQLEMVKKLELSDSDHNILNEHCLKNNIKFLSTAFDFESINLLDQFQMDYFKIPSGEVTNLPYLRKVANLNKEIIISTGMCTLSEIEQALNILMAGGILKNRVTVLHCNTEYPTPMSDVNLNAMLTIKRELDIHIGYSDHTLGIEVPIAAVALGAKIIEKHFTLSRQLSGPDHRASLEPNELTEMIKCIRNIEMALGDGVKMPSQSELKNIKIARKSIVAKTNIKKGELFTEDNICVKRPGTGISPMQWDNVIGAMALRDYFEDDLI